jgi:hypothetical protein
MTPTDVAQVIWSIFLDARNYYGNSVTDPLPTSNLVMLRMYLQTGSIKASLNCPVERLLGMSQGVTVVTDTASLMSSMSSMSGSSAFSPASARSASTKVNAHFHVAFKRATEELIGKHPAARFTDVMNAPQERLKYSEVRMGPSGSCLDMHYFGRCSTEGCAYKHGVVGAVPEARATKILPKLKVAVAEYVLAQG